MTSTAITTLVLCIAVASPSPRLTAQQSTVAPASAATADANSILWLPGVTVPFRQQTLIGAQHLTPVVGRQIRGIAFRRDVGATPEARIGGRVWLDVHVSTSPRTPGTASEILVENTGGDVVQAFVGAVDVPDAPPVVGGVAPWDDENTVRIPFLTPFGYAGGTLCLDLDGAPIVVSPSWPADAVRDPVSGSVAIVGSACGPYARGDSATAHAAAGRLVPGSTAVLYAAGAPYSPAMLAIGARAVERSFDLSLLGAPQGCYVHVDPIVAMVGTAFGPLLEPLTPFAGARARVTMPVPTSPGVLGARFAFQWFELGAELFSSNAVECAIAGRFPTLGMATVFARSATGPPPPRGSVQTHLAHVIRLELGD